MPRTTRALGLLVAALAAATLTVALTTTATVAATNPPATTSVSGTGPAPGAAPSGTPSGSDQPCADPGPAPTGVTASASLVGSATSQVQARITWPPLVEPAHCGAGVVEIEQVSPPGPTTRAPSADGQVVIGNLTTLTPYTWRLRYVAGTVSEWATVSVPQVLPLDYCLGLPGPRTITATLLSATSVHLEWGALNYPAACGGTVTVRALTSSTPVASVGPAQTGVTLTGLTPGSTTTWVVSFLVELGRVTVIQPGGAAATCSAAAHLDSVWDTGLVATVTVTNTGTAALRGWAAGWILPPGVRLSSAWNALATVKGGTLTATNTTWNGALAPGASTTFGVLAARSGGGTVAVPALTCTATPAGTA